MVEILGFKIEILVLRFYLQMIVGFRV